MIVNTSLMKSPVNWLIVWSVLLVAGYTAHLILSHYNGTHPGEAES